ncbi:TraM recognition domain-containing protein [Leifsonia sp. H3M29-4]|nr:TraM recognition domain-containing protein [Salinibacterium metalliresistens]MDF1477739.1 TraM recognition domain-containing protein [Salinibacterium metalliresistens]
MGLLNGRKLRTEPHGMFVGKTGSGKTRCALAPAALMHRGARILVSSKSDFLELTLNRGLGDAGAVYVMDLNNELEGVDWLTGSEYIKVVPDPTLAIQNDDDASRMATLLLQTAALGTSGGSNGGGDNAIWEQLAQQPLAALLLAGKAAGGGIVWTTRAAGKFTRREAEPENTPSWSYAYGLIEDSFHAADLLTTLGADEKLRDNVAATVRSALKAWTLHSVRGDAGAVPFTPSMLEGPGEPTLFILSGSSGPQATAAVTTIEGVIEHWRRNLRRQLPWLLIAIDELTNTAPIPADLLVSHITELRGLRISMLLGVQSTDGQLELRYGTSGAKAIRQTVPAVLILRNADEWDLLEAATKWQGDEDRQRQTTDAAGNVMSVSSERFPRRTAHELLPPDSDHGRLILTGGRTHLVELPNIEQFPKRPITTAA